MPWPWSSSDRSDRSEHSDRSDRPPREPQWTSPLNATSWPSYTEPRTLLPTVLATASALLLVRLYKSYLRRIPSTSHIKPAAFRRRSLFGLVTSVGDADNFRLFHTPGGRLAGWGWLPGRRVPRKREELGRKTIHIRLAGVDAPELAHFGRPAQPHSSEALAFLTALLLHRRVRAHIHRRDQYDRVVATVFVRRWLRRRDVGLEMLKQGLATVYEAKQGAEFGGVEGVYREAERVAKERGRGMWARPGLLERVVGGGKGGEVETPREFKMRMAAGEVGLRRKKGVVK